MRLWLLLSLIIFSASAFADTLTGRAVVKDGDSIEIHGEELRLHGIDAPESAQHCRGGDGAPWPCGREAATELDNFLVGARPTHCQIVDHDKRWDRPVAVCQRDDGQDVNDWLVRNGWALDWPRYSQGAYADAQVEAEANDRGLWQGEFVRPWEWRRGVRLDWRRSSTPSDPACPIKGNINAEGEYIFHVPGGQFYDQTVVDESRGQRWFCTEQEALDAGWRPAQR